MSGENVAFFGALQRVLAELLAELERARLARHAVARMKLWPGGTLEHEAGTSWCGIALPAGKKPNM